MDLIRKIKELMATITGTMDEDSQYDDYEPEFTNIEASIETLESVLKDHAIIKAYHDMWKAMYVNKGSLDCSLQEILHFQMCVDKGMSVAKL
jgi:DNA/RNA-binding domain of Phe-tRNA-synthetase-like protein